MGTTPDDNDLLARVALGDKAAMERLAADYHPRLWRYLARQLGGDASLIEDVLQEVYLAIWRSADSFRGSARVSTWIFQIAHHRMVDARRARTQRHARIQVLSHGGDDEGGEVNSATPEMVPSHEDAVLDRLALAEALRALSPRQREALDLVCQYGFTVDETASILGVPPGTVKSRLSYARRALGAALLKEVPS